MAKSAETETPVEAVQLKDPALAAFLAWLIPGLGHLYQGRTAKAALFFVCIMGTFVYGLYLGSSSDPRIGWARVVYFSWEPYNKRLPYLCQIGAGLPALPALIQAQRMSNNKPVWLHGFMAPPRTSSGGNDANADQPTQHDTYIALSHYFDLGTVYTMIAGLLNVLAIYDAWGGPVFVESGKKEDEEEDDAEEAQPAPAAPKSN